MGLYIENGWKISVLETKNGDQVALIAVRNFQPTGLNPRQALEGFKVASRFFTVAACFQIVRYFLVVVQTRQASAFNSRDVYKHVRAALIGLNEAEAFCRVKPFYGASGHSVFS
jgi:hypothetical protein